jgi:SulP family sulfate permease
LKRFIEKGELWGGLSAAIISLPMSIAYGIAVFAALGPGFQPQATLIGINTAVIGGLVAALLGGTPGQVSGPGAPLALIMTTVVAGLAADPLLQQLSSDSQWTVLGLASFCVASGGMIQVVWGVLGMGNIIKYIPFPVVSGFMNGIAVLLIWNQMPAFVGLSAADVITGGFAGFSVNQGVTVCTGTVTLVSIFVSRRCIRSVPPILAGLIVGNAVFLLMPLLVPVPYSIATIGDLRAGLALPTAFSCVLHIPFRSFPTLWFLKFILYGVVLALVGSMESMMSAVAIDNIRGSRHNSKRELIGQGIGNIVASFFGSISAAGSVTRSMANHHAGGRRRLSGVICSSLILMIFATLAPLIGKIPLAVFAAIIIFVGINLFDRSTLCLVQALGRSGGARRDVTVSLLINLGVAAITVSINLIWAVLAGMAISTAYFIVKMGTSVIRREYTAELICSNRVRDCRQAATLNENKKVIRVFELQGPIFFGSAERLAQIVEARMVDATYCILDMRQVTDIDITGGNILMRLRYRLRKMSKRLLISHVSANRGLLDILAISGGKEDITEEHIFPNTDLALEWCEDRLLAQKCATAECRQYEWNALDIFAGFSAHELEQINPLLTKETFRKGTHIITEGKKDRDLYLLTRGSVSVKIKLPLSDGERRLFSFSAGVVFGEMALLDGKPRSARVQADADVEVYRLSYGNFEILLARQPQIAARLLKNIALVLSHRLRVRSDELRMMADV